MKNVKIEAKNGVISITSKEGTEKREILYKQRLLNAVHIREMDIGVILTIELDIAEYFLLPNSTYESGLDGELSLFVESVNGIETNDFETLKNEVKRLMYE